MASPASTSAAERGGRDGASWQSGPDLAGARSYLYVPADRPTMLARATERGADALIVDLEDAVAPQAKPAARRNVAAWLDALPASSARQVWVRINPAAGPRPPLDDLNIAVHAAVTGVVQAKCESLDELLRLDDALSVAEGRAGLAQGTLAVAPLIESAAGVLAMPALAAAPRVRRLQVGEADLSAELGMEPGDDHAEFAGLRWTLVLTSAAAGLEAPVGPVETRLGELAGLRASTQALRRQGFGGRGAVHPAQVPVINDVFTPSGAELEQAAMIVERFGTAVASGSGVAVTDDGRMIDEAVVRTARRVLARGRVAGRQS
jgi:citrate lyase subunit beta / citryl-CoA lyase